MTKNTLNPQALGYAAAILSAACMLIIWVLGNARVYLNGVEAMQKWHLFFSLSFGGLIAGLVEATVFGFVVAYTFAWLYNKFI